MNRGNSSKESSGLTRRKALQIFGASLLGLTAVSASGCKPQNAAKTAPTNVVPPQAAGKVEAGQMTYRTDPRNGQKISMLGFGCMRFPTLPSPQDPEKQVIDEENSYKLVDYAWQHGVNYYDTAYFYHDGKSEAMIGKALARYPRNSYFIADKMPTRCIESLEQAKEIFKGQLEKCQVEYFDYYLLHNLNNLDDCKRVYQEYGVLDFLLEQKKQGRIRSLGWSFHGDRELFNYALNEMGVDWDFVQIQMNYHDWIFGDERRSSEPIPAQWMYEELTKRKIPVIIMEPLLGGRLARLNVPALEALKSANPQATPASWAFRYFGDFPNVLTVLSGMTYMEHLQDNIKTFSPLQPLNSSEQRVLDQALTLFRNSYSIPCTGCDYCMPCPYGVNIPAVFAHYNKCVAQGTLPSDSQDPDYQKHRRQFLMGYNRVANPLQQADRCISCGLCVKKCPQKLAIPRELKNIYNLTESLHQMPFEDKKGGK